MRFPMTRLRATRAITLGVCLAGFVASPLGGGAPGAAAASGSSQADDPQGCPAGNFCAWQYAEYAGAKQAGSVTPACTNLKEKSASMDNNSPDRVQVFLGADCKSASATVQPGGHGTLNASNSPVGDSDMGFIYSFRKK
jgi:hypothetical protein